MNAAGPVLHILNTFDQFGVKCLLMGGQACILYGAAEFSKDVDFALFADEENLERLQKALEALTEALDEEEKNERKADERYWQPLRKMLADLRHQK